MLPPMVDIVIAGAWSSDGLAATLASLAAQRYPAFGIAAPRPADEREGSAVQGLAAILEARGHPVRLRDLSALVVPAARRQALLDRVTAPYVLDVDDDLFLEPDLMGRLVAAIRATSCGFVGSSLIDLRDLSQHHPAEELIDFWEGPVRPEDVRAGSPAWARRALHRGANLEHLRERLPRTRDRLYRVADIHGCVLYDVAALRAIGGFRPPARPDRWGPISLEAAAQLRLLARSGGAGLFPSGAYRLAPRGARRPIQSQAQEASTPAGAETGGAELVTLRASWIRPWHAWQRVGRTATAARRLPHQIRAPRPHRPPSREAVARSRSTPSIQGGRP